MLGALAALGLCCVGALRVDTIVLHPSYTLEYEQKLSLDLVLDRSDDSLYYSFQACDCNTCALEACSGFMEYGLTYIGVEVFSKRLTINCLSDLGYYTGTDTEGATDPLDVTLDLVCRSEKGCSSNGYPLVMCRYYDVSGPVKPPSTVRVGSASNPKVVSSGTIAAIVVVVVIVVCIFALCLVVVCYRMKRRKAAADEDEDLAVIAHDRHSDDYDRRDDDDYSDDQDWEDAQAVVHRRRADVWSEEELEDYRRREDAHRRNADFFD